MTSKVENAAATTSTMAYADGDHLTTLTTGGVATTLAYDALGRTATRERAGSTETYRYAGTSEAVYEIGDGATARTALVDGAGARLAWTSGGTTAWTLFDHLGSIARGWATTVTSAEFPQTTVKAATALQWPGVGPALFIPREFFPFGPVVIR